MSENYDVLIIGAGPAGLAAAIYTGRARLNTLILEKGVAGGQILMTDFIENYPGFPDGIVPFELIELLQKQAEKFGARTEMDEIISIKEEKNLLRAESRKNEYLTRSIIVATGSSHRRLNVPGVTDFIGKGISFCATCDGPFYRDQTVGVVGGGSWALTEALFLTKFARSVKIIHRRDKFRGERILQERVFQNDKIEILWDSVVEEISGGGMLESVNIKNLKTGERREEKFNGFFISIGTDPNTQFLKDLVEINQWGEIVVNKSMMTTVPGIFAAGDVTDACPNQVATAAGTGVAAAMAIDEYLT